MNITQVSNSFNNKLNNNQSFKGLWGKSSLVSDEDPGMGVFTNRETRYYHPFADESHEEVLSTMTRNSDAYINTEECTYVIKECKLCAPLSFTKTDYEKYKTAHSFTTLTDSIKRIHEEVKDKYTNCERDKQNSAVNDVVGSRLSANI